MCYVNLSFSLFALRLNLPRKRLVLYNSQRLLKLVRILANLAACCKSNPQLVCWRRITTLLTQSTHRLETYLPKTMNPLLLTENAWTHVVFCFFRLFFLLTLRSVHHFVSPGILMGPYIVKNVFFLVFRQILVTGVLIIDWVIKILWKIFLKNDFILTNPSINLILFMILPFSLLHFPRLDNLSRKVTLIICNRPFNSNIL